VPKLTTRQSTAACLVAAAACGYVGHFGMALLATACAVVGSREEIATALSRLRPRRSGRA
jgi:hypothetical protein